MHIKRTFFWAPPILRSTILIYKALLTFKNSFFILFPTIRSTLQQTQYLCALINNLTEFNYSKYQYEQIKKNGLENKENELENQSEKEVQSTEQKENTPRRGRPKGKEVIGINKNQEKNLGDLLDEYIEGSFLIAGSKKTLPKELELAPFIDRIAKTKLFLNDNQTPMSKSTLTKMAEEIWQKDDRVRHNEKHHEKTPRKSGRN